MYSFFIFFARTTKTKFYYKPTPHKTNDKKNIQKSVKSKITTLRKTKNHEIVELLYKSTFEFTLNITYNQQKKKNHPQSHNPTAEDSDRCILIFI